MNKQGLQGFSITEVMVVVAILGITAMLAAPLFDDAQDNQNLRQVSRDVGNTLTLARQLAVQTGNNQIVYLATTAGTDVCGNDLADASGNRVPLLVLDDGPPGGGGNCCIDAGESVVTRPPQDNISWGSTYAAAAHPDDAGSGGFTTGATFADPAGAQTRWVMFRPDGVPVGFTNACVEGELGSGAGAIYLTNAERDYAAILSPLGAVKVRGFDRSANAWSD